VTFLLAIGIALTVVASAFIAGTNGDPEAAQVAAARLEVDEP
jgi:hypothetical protein